MNIVNVPYKTNKSKHYPGEVLGVHVLIAPRGNPEHGNAMAWDYRCGVCGAICVIESHVITNLRGRKGCRYCSGPRKKTNRRQKMIITRQQLRDWGACYTDEKIAELVPPEGLTPLQVLDADVPAVDRLWVVLHEEVIPARELRLLACKWARRALALAGNPDPRSVAAVDTAERFARGAATATELAAARDAARDAAMDATLAAARAAAMDAARDAALAAASVAARDAALAAARAAARSAARDAALAAARAAAWDAALAAARAAQIEDCKATLSEQ